MAATVDPTVERCLVSRARQGEPAAFEALVREHGPFVFNLALRTLGDSNDAEDAAQEAFVRAWRGLATFREDASFKTWLYRIVVRVCYDRLPRLHRDLASLDAESAIDVSDGRQDVQQQVQMNDTAVLVRQTIDLLPESYRLLITLRHLHELSYKEIANVTGMPLGTVKVGLHRARKLLRSMMLEQTDGEACRESA